MPARSVAGESEPKTPDSFSNVVLKLHHRRTVCRNHVLLSLLQLQRRRDSKSENVMPGLRLRVSSSLRDAGFPRPSLLLSRVVIATWIHLSARRRPVAGSRTCAKVFRRKDKSNKQWIIGLSDMEFGMVSLANLHIPIMRRCRKEGSFLSQSKRFRSLGRRPFRIVLR